MTRIERKKREGESQTMTILFIQVIFGDANNRFWYLRRFLFFFSATTICFWQWYPLEYPTNEQEEKKKKEIKKQKLRKEQQVFFFSKKKE